MSTNAASSKVMLFATRTTLTRNAYGPYSLIEGKDGYFLQVNFLVAGLCFGELKIWKLRIEAQIFKTKKKNLQVTVDSIKVLVKGH